MTITKASKQSKLMQYITTPFRVIGTVRDFYMKTIFDCAGRIGEGGVVSCHATQVSRIPDKFDVYLSNAKNYDDHIKGLILVVSKKKELNWRMASYNVPKREAVDMGVSGVGRSYSVGVGRIGRIDEDKSCDFEKEDDHVKRKEYLFIPRSRSSYVVTKRNIVVHY